MRTMYLFLVALAACGGPVQTSEATETVDGRWSLEMNGASAELRIDHDRAALDFGGHTVEMVRETDSFRGQIDVTHWMDVRVTPSADGVAGRVCIREQQGGKRGPSQIIELWCLDFVGHAAL